MITDTNVTYLRRAAAALRAQAGRPGYRPRQSFEMIGRAAVLDRAVLALLASPNRRAIRNAKPTGKGGGKKGGGGKGC